METIRENNLNSPVSDTCEELKHDTLFTSENMRKLKLKPAEVKLKVKPTPKSKPKQAQKANPKSKPKARPIDEPKFLDGSATDEDEATDEELTPLVKTPKVYKKLGRKPQPNKKKLLKLIRSLDDDNCAYLIAEHNKKNATSTVE